jgi:polysaccharide chain length determinant protein (PEP-CTERM system associated)
MDLRKLVRLIVRRQRLFVAAAFLVITAVIVTCYLLPDRYEARCTVFIEKSVISDLVKGIAVTPSIEDKVKVLAYAIKSRTLLLKVLNDLDINLSKLDDAGREKLVKEFQDNTDIKLKDREGLFIISFHHQNPQLARDYVNTLVRRYIEENISAKREDSYGATRFLTEQIAGVKAKLDQAEEKLNDFKQINGGALAEGENLLTAQINEAREKLDEASLKRGQLAEQRAALGKSDPRQYKLAALQRRLSELTLVYTDQYPEVAELKKAIATLKEQIGAGRGTEEVGSPEMERLAREQNAQQAQERSQQRLIAAKQAQLHRLPALRAAVEDLERERNSQKTLYEQLVARLGQSEVSKQLEVQDKSATFRIVDPAVVPVKPSSPNRVLIMALGLVGGFAASLGLLLVLDHQDKTVKSLDELKKLGLPILAVVPRIRTAEELAAGKSRNRKFLLASGAYFALILATLSLELLRSSAIFPMHPSQLHQKVAQFKELVAR